MARNKKSSSDIQGFEFHKPWNQFFAPVGLIQQGIYETNLSRKIFLRKLEEMRTWDGKKLSGDLKERLVREYERLQKVEEQRKELAGEREEDAKVSKSPILVNRKIAEYVPVRIIDKSPAFFNE